MVPKKQKLKNTYKTLREVIQERNICCEDAKNKKFESNGMICGIRVSMYTAPCHQLFMLYAACTMCMTSINKLCINICHKTFKTQQ